MPKICLYLQLHQPYRLQELSILDVGNDHDYFSKSSTNANLEIFNKVTTKSYRPMLKMLIFLLKKFPNLVFSLSCSGVFLEQAKVFEPQVIELLQALGKTGRVEFLAETYHHTLASLYSEAEFVRQIQQHSKLIQELFNQWPVVFRNTELIYDNKIAQLVANMGFVGMLTEGVDRYLNDRTRTQIFASMTKQHMPLLLKHARLSDDIAFRFSDKSWDWYPLKTKQYLDWLLQYSQSAYVNLFMDFETFGEHQWEDSGIFEFFVELVARTSGQPQYGGLKYQSDWVLPNQVFLSPQTQSQLDLLETYDVSQPISWADIDRDLSAWTDNSLQKDSLRTLYDLENQVIATHNEQTIDTWRRLQTSDHFYYMCTKWFADGDVHAYFSPFTSPYEAYRQYSIVLADLQHRLIY